MLRDAASTLTLNKDYFLNFYLPFTHPTLPIPSATGSLYAPYASLIASCNNTYSFSTAYNQQDIEITNSVLIGESKSFDSSLSFHVEFSGSRSTLFSSSSIDIVFNSSILTSRSVCTFTPDYQYWGSYAINSPTNTIMTLYPK